MTTLHFIYATVVTIEKLVNKCALVGCAIVFVICFFFMIIFAYVKIAPVFLSVQPHEGIDMLIVRASIGLYVSYRSLRKYSVATKNKTK